MIDSQPRPIVQLDAGTEVAGRGTPESVFVCNTLAGMVAEPFDLDLLDDRDRFEIDSQAAHLFKHPNLGTDDI